MLYSIKYHKTIISIIYKLLNNEIHIVNGLEIEIKGLPRGEGSVMVIRMDECKEPGYEPNLYVSVFKTKNYTPSQYKKIFPNVPILSKDKNITTRRILFGGWVRKTDNEYILNETIQQFENYIGKNF